MAFGLLYVSSFVISLILIVQLLKTSKTDITKYLFSLAVFVSFWLLMEAASFVSPISWILLFQKLKYIGIIPVAPTLLIAALVFIKKYSKINMLIKLSFYAIPLCCLLSAMTGIYPFPFLSNPRVQIINQIPIYLYEKQIGFWIHTVYSYFLVLITCYLLFIRAKKSPKIYRRQSMFIFLGCICTFVINFLFVTKFQLYRVIDTTPITVLMTLLFFFWGVFHLPKLMIVPYARNLVIESMQDLIIVVDNDDCMIDINPSAIRLASIYVNNAGNNRTENNSTENNSNEKDKEKQKRSVVLKDLVGMPLQELYKGAGQIEEQLNGVTDFNELILCLHDGSKNNYYKLVIEEVIDSDHRKIGRLFLLQDITEIKEQLNHLLKLNAELDISDKIIKDALEGIIITDSNNNIVSVNDSMSLMSGYGREELLGQNPRIMRSDYHETAFYHKMWKQILESGSWEGEIWDKKKNGEIYPKWMSIKTILGKDGKTANYIAISSDISKMKKAEQDIQLLSYYDALIGIPNRTLFYDRMKTALARAKMSGLPLVLFFMDLDRFKMINDSLGHDVGDQVLVEASTRIKSVIREGDTLSRLGGDEFTLIIEENQNTDEIVMIAENIVEQIGRPFFIKGKELSIGISIGIAIAPYDDTTIEGLIRKADSAMYVAKETGRGKFVFSSSEIEKKSQELMEMQLKLKEAIQNEEFRLFLQPQMSFIEGKYQLVGAEALIRWYCKEEIIPPSLFIPAAEDNGLILPIGNWIVKEIFRIDRRLKEQGIDIQLAINVSIKQFENKEMIWLLQQMLEEFAQQQIRLVIEITESMFIHDLQWAVEYLNELKRMGIKIAIDDFGTGFSSLSYLTRLPMDYVKIDQSFVSQLDEEQNRNLTYSIITMAKTLGLKTLAEGVETMEQAKILTQKECDELQGYYFSKPMPVEEFVVWSQKLLLLGSENGE